MTDRIRLQLEDDIVNGALRPGERLDPFALAERFGCSRTPVREALQVLDASGLVMVLPKRGTFVSARSAVDLVERFAVMAELEGMATRLATGLIGWARTAEIKVALDDCEAAVDAGDPERYYEANARFHGGLYDSCGNAYLEKEVHDLHRLLRPYRKAQLSAPHRMRQSLVEHRQIFQAVTTGQADLAGALARKHVYVQVQEYRLLTDHIEQRRT